MRRWFSNLLNKPTHKTDGAQLVLRREIDDLIRQVSQVPQAHLEDAITLLGNDLYRIGLDRLRSGLPAQAALALSKALELGVDKPYVAYNLAVAYNRSGQAVQAHGFFERAFDEAHADTAGDGYYLRNMHALEGVSLEDLHRVAGDWANKHTKNIARKHTSMALPKQQQKLRVGLISARFCRHAVGFLSVQALEHVDQSKIEMILYANGSPEDDYTQRFRALASDWHDITALSDEQAADLIESHRLDILVDMAGHSSGSRMKVLALKPAPVQAKWVGGQHGTTGVAALDFFMTDLVETPEEDDQYFYETPVRLPHAYACYAPPHDAPDVSAAPLESRSAITFGSFNNIAKMSDRTLEVWAEILRAVPNSRLVLKHLALAEEEVRDRLAAEFSALNVSPNRLELRPPTDQLSHLESYADIDISLDPMPWVGCVTTCESLWMGVPVLTLPGVAFCHRHSASFLYAVGLEEWVAIDTDDYVAKAISFAGQAGLLSTLRADLRGRMRVSPLCDGPRFAQDLEKLLFQICQGPAE